MPNKYFPLNVIFPSDWYFDFVCWRKSAFQLICLKRSGDDQVRRDWCSFLWKFNQFPTSFSKRLLISRTRSKSESSKFQLLRNHDCWNNPKKKSHWHPILKLENVRLKVFDINVSLCEISVDIWTMMNMLMSMMLMKIWKMWTMEWWSNCGWWQLGEGVE